MKKRTMMLTSMVLVVLMVMMCVPMTAFAETIDNTLGVPVLAINVAGNEDYPIDPYVVVDVTWELIDGAEGYEAQRKEGEGEWEVLEDNFGADIYGFNILDSKVGATYTYRVRAFRTVNGEKNYSEWGTGEVTIPESSFRAVILAADQDYELITWTMYAGAAGYSVERSDSETGTFTVVGEGAADDFMFIDYPLDRGKTYYYKVRPFTMNGTEKVYGNYSDVVSAPTAPTEDFFTGTVRLAGSNRYNTAIKAADFYKNIYGQIYDVFDKIDPTDKFRTIIVASGENYADALAGSYLAAVLKAPILLVHPSLEGQVEAYIRENLAETGSVYILGGTGSVSERFENSLGDFYVERLSGSNRYKTNLEILKAAGVDSTDIVVCSGKNFADALSASSLQLPIMLAGDTLTSEQLAYLEDISVGDIYIVGGTGSVSIAVENQLKKFDNELERIFGANRYETSLAVARRFFEDSAETAVLAYGGNFPDGLSGAPIAIGLREPIILAENSDKVIAKIAEYADYSGIKKAIVFGGPTYISDENVNKIIQ